MKQSSLYAAIKSNNSIAKIKYNGVAYEVRANISIVQALKEVGMIFVHGVSCQQGVCGACSVIYRNTETTGMKGALACQKLITDGMEIMPATYSTFAVNAFNQRSEDPINTLLSTYSEMHSCIDCNACNEICPISLDIKGAMQAIKDWNLADTVSKSSGCVMCGLCSLRCPVYIRPEVISMQAKGALGFKLTQTSASIGRDWPDKKEKERQELDNLCSMNTVDLIDKAEALRLEVLKLLSRQEKEVPKKD
tara:strand:- start:565 stop:1314 length:750 start_codon:yes stop_codon:yes gene_type:complete